MQDNRPFNYIVTIHNKEDLLERVLAGCAECAGPGALILPVLDGCTDGSESVARKFADTCGVETKVLTAPDVHEILSINTALREAKPGYCVFVQDDIILQEPKLEDKIRALCAGYDNKLGYITCRLGVDISPAPLARRLRLVRRFGLRAMQPLILETNLIAHPREQLSVAKADYDSFQVRMSGIKGPVCITPELRTHEPLLDEDLAPYCYDDVDLSMRSLKRGLTNGLYAIRFETRDEWSGTKKDPEFASYGNFVRWRNRCLIWKKHGDFIQTYIRQHHGVG